MFPRIITKRTRRSLRPQLSQPALAPDSFPYQRVEKQLRPRLQLRPALQHSLRRRQQMLPERPELRKSFSLENEPSEPPIRVHALRILGDRSGQDQRPPTVRSRYGAHDPPVFVPRGRLRQRLGQPAQIRAVQRQPFGFDGRDSADKHAARAFEQVLVNDPLRRIGP